MKKRTSITFIMLFLGLIGYSQKSYGQLLTNDLFSSTGSFVFENYQNNIVFSTSIGNNATSYTWVIDDTYSVTTPTPYINLSSTDFIWYPSGGCLSFNEDYWKANFPGSLGKKPWSLGTYSVSFKVVANTGESSQVKTIKVKNVKRCTDFMSILWEGHGKD